MSLLGKSHGQRSLAGCSPWNHRVGLHFPGGSVVKNLPMPETQGWHRGSSLGWNDPLVKEVATHSSILASEIHGQKYLAGYSPRGQKIVRNNLVTKQQQILSCWKSCWWFCSLHPNSLSCLEEGICISELWDLKKLGVNKDSRILWEGKECRIRW